MAGAARWSVSASQQGHLADFERGFDRDLGDGNDDGPGLGGRGGDGRVGSGCGARFDEAVGGAEEERGLAECADQVLNNRTACAAVNHPFVGLCIFASFFSSCLCLSHAGYCFPRVSASFLKPPIAPDHAHRLMFTPRWPACPPRTLRPPQAALLPGVTCLSPAQRARRFGAPLLAALAHASRELSGRPAQALVPLLGSAAHAMREAFAFAGDASLEAPHGGGGGTGGGAGGLAAAEACAVAAVAELAAAKGMLGTVRGPASASGTAGAGSKAKSAAKAQAKSAGGAAGGGGVGAVIGLSLSALPLPVFAESLRRMGLDLGCREVGSSVDKT